MGDDMIKVNSRFASIIIAVLMPIMFTVCDSESAPAPQFTSSEYTIASVEVQEKLNLEPHYIYSSDEAVVTGEIKSSGIVIISKGQGKATVTIGDAAGLCNSARIELEVEASGTIKPDIFKFEGNPVKAIIKEDIRISGKVHNEITPATVKLMMDNNDFTAVAVDNDVSSWITNLPQGLSAKISYIQAGEYIHEVNLTVSGEPQTPYTGILTITIPAVNSAQNWDVYVTTREEAKFEIVE
jgi:hypothetical protein